MEFIKACERPKVAQMTPRCIHASQLEDVQHSLPPKFVRARAATKPVLVFETLPRTRNSRNGRPAANHLQAPHEALHVLDGSEELGVTSASRSPSSPKQPATAAKSTKSNLRAVSRCRSGSAPRFGVNAEMLAAPPEATKVQSKDSSPEHPKISPYEPLCALET